MSPMGSKHQELVPGGKAQGKISSWPLASWSERPVVVPDVLGAVTCGAGMSAYRAAEG